MGFFDSSSTKNFSSSTNPWAPQGAALQTAFNDANGALTQAQGVQLPSNFVAQMTPDQLATFKSMVGYSNNNTLPSSMGAAYGTNVNAGTDAATNAISGYNGFDPSAALSTPNVLSTAQAYMSGQNIPAQVRAAMQQGVETARDITNPQIVNNADVTGNADSSRTGIAQGLVDRGLAEQASNMTGALESSAWNNAITSALNTGQNLNADTLQKLQSEGALGNNTTTTGLNLGNSSVNDQGALFNYGTTGGAGEQAAAQAKLDNALQKYQFGVQAPFTPINNYMGIVGSNNWGGTTTGTETTKSDPSFMSVLGGLLGTAGMAMGGAGQMGFKFSDRRLKTDINRVGTLANGLPVYTFRYKGFEHVYLGLMADEVEKVHPEAVIEGPRGFKMVNYAKAVV